MKEKANWTQNGLLTVIIIMMGWFMVDFSGWKGDIKEELKYNHDATQQHIKEELIKNQKQDIRIIQNNTKILQLEKENEEVRELLKIGGF